MRNSKIFNYILYLAIAMVMFSCSNDDDASNVSSIIQIGDNSFEVVNVIAFNRGTFNGNTSFRLYFTDSGLSIDGNENISGNGNFLSVIMLSDISNGIQTGNYTYDITQSATPFSMAVGYYFLNYSDGLNSNNNSVDIVSGTISVSRKNDSYTFNINLVNTQNSAVTGTFTGIIPIVEDE